MPDRHQDELLWHIAQASFGDPHLERILEMVSGNPEAYVTLTLTVVVGGAEVTGLLTTPEAGAQRFDALLQEGVGKQSEPDAQEQFETLSEALYGARTAADLVAQSRAKAAKIYAAAEATGIPHEEFVERLSEVPDDLIRKLTFAGAPPSHVWFTDAMVTTIRGAAAVPVLRVKVAAIEAWWLGGR
jgi:hypothetical protein